MFFTTSSKVASRLTWTSRGATFCTASAGIWTPSSRVSPGTAWVDTPALVDNGADTGEVCPNAALNAGDGLDWTGFSDARPVDALLLVMPGVPAVSPDRSCIDISEFPIGRSPLLPDDHGSGRGAAGGVEGFELTLNSPGVVPPDTFSGRLLANVVNEDAGCVSPSFTCTRNPLFSGSPELAGLSPDEIESPKSAGLRGGNCEVPGLAAGFSAWERSPFGDTASIPFAKLSVLAGGEEFGVPFWASGGAAGGCCELKPDPELPKLPPEKLPPGRFPPLDGEFAGGGKSLLIFLSSADATSLPGADGGVEDFVLLRFERSGFCGGDCGSRPAGGVAAVLLLS